MFGDILFTTFVNMLFSLRMYALFGGDKRVLGFFVALCIAEYGAEFYTVFVSAQTATRAAFLAPPGVPIPGCLTVGLPERLTLIAWIPNLTVNSLFFIVSMFKLWKWTGTHGTLRSAHGSGPTVFDVILRDGTVFYFVTMAVVVVNMVTALIQGARLNLLTTPWLITAYSFSGAHIILNLRKAAAKGVIGVNTSAFVSETLNADSILFRRGVDSSATRLPQHPSAKVSRGTERHRDF